MHPEVRVRVPAAAEYVHVLRAVVTGLAGRERLTVDDIEDLRLAIDESCSQLLGIPGPSTVLEVEIVTEEGHLRVFARIDADPAEWPSSDPRAELSRTIVGALADDVTYERDMRGPGVSFSKRRPVSV